MVKPFNHPPFPFAYSSFNSLSFCTTAEGDHEQDEEGDEDEPAAPKSKLHSMLCFLCLLVDDVFVSIIIRAIKTKCETSSSELSTT
jgi:hypothetical protein